MGVSKQTNATSPSSTSTSAPHASRDAHHLPLAGKHYGSLAGHPILLAAGAEEAGGAGGAITAALSARSHAGDVVVSLILIVIVCFVTAMATFFWKKYKTIHARSASYEYSQLSQCERETSDLNEIADDLGLSMGTSTDEEELEAASPATIPVTASYISPKAVPPTLTPVNESDMKSLMNNNNILNMNNNSDMPSTCLSPDEVPTTHSLIHAPVPLLLQMPPPLQPEPAAAPAAPTGPHHPSRPLFNDSDEELLQ